jgi:hypothetical protein
MLCAGRCQLDMALYSEDHPDGATEPVYPINAVRNRALQMVETQASPVAALFHGSRWG